MFSPCFASFPRSFLEAQHRCTDLGATCAGITCEASAASSKVAPTKCTARRGARGGVRRSPREEVSYVKEVSYSNLEKLGETWKNWEKKSTFGRKSKELKGTSKVSCIRIYLMGFTSQVGSGQ